MVEYHGWLLKFPGSGCEDEARNGPEQEMIHNGMEC